MKRMITYAIPSRIKLEQNQDDILFIVVGHFEIENSIYLLFKLLSYLHTQADKRTDAQTRMYIHNLCLCYTLTHIHNAPEYSWYLVYTLTHLHLSLPAKQMTVKCQKWILILQFTWCVVRLPQIKKQQQIDQEPTYCLSYSKNCRWFSYGRVYTCTNTNTNRAWKKYYIEKC